MNQDDTKKKTKATAEPSATIPTTTKPSLSSFPDAVTTYLSSFMRNRELKRLRGTSPKLLEAYGGKMVEMTLRSRSDIPTSHKAFFSLLAKQERLEKLTLTSISLLPSLLVSISSGHARYLKELHLTVKEGRKTPALDMSHIMPLAILIAKGQLPHLERLRSELKWRKGGIALLIDGFRNGACPKLHSLGCFLYEVGDGSDGGMEAVANFVESRQHLPGCSPIKELSGAWAVHGSDQVRVRLLRALLPYMEEFDEMPTMTSAMARMIKEMGAPCLQELSVSDYSNTDVSFVPLIEALNLVALPSLQRVQFAGKALDAACVEKLLELLRQQNHHLLPPKLSSVTFLMPSFKHAADEERFFTSVGKEEGIYFPSSVRTVHYSPKNNIQPLTSALSRSAFPGVAELRIDSGDIGDGGMAALCQVLQTTSCANQLERLSLFYCNMKLAHVRVLADVFQQGGLPSLRDFGVQGNALGDDGVNRLVTALKVARHASLQSLCVSNVGMSDAVLKDLAAAVEEEGSFVNLQQLYLSGNMKITDTGVLAFSKAIAAGYTPKLVDLTLHETSLNERGGSAVALLSFLLANCPDFRRLTLPKKIDAGCREVIEGLLQSLDREGRISIEYL